MQKNEFEKQMQQKMDELQIQPSESVWENVRLQITKQKRRRWGVLLLLIALIIISSGGYWMLHSDNSNMLHKQNNITVNKNSDKSLTTDKPSATNEILKTAKNYNGHNKTSDQIVAIKSHKNVSTKIIALSVSTSGIYKSSSEKTFKQLNQEKNRYSDTKQIEINSYADKAKPALKEIDETKELPESGMAQMDLLSQSSPKKIELKADTLITNTLTKNANASKKVNKWILGLSFSAGISGIGDNFLGFNEDKNLAADPYLNSGSGNGSFIITPSEKQRSGAFTAGFVAEKNISKKKMISVGLNYKMFSTTNKVGQSNGNSRSYSLSNAVSSYRNYYHFLELPVSLKIQISDKKTPLFWDAGISISQLISSNALQYNNGAAFYHHDNSLFNKSQIGFNTGFSLSLLSTGNTSLLFSPYVYYSTTRFAKEGLYKNQHFTFIGLKSQILFKK